MLETRDGYPPSECESRSDALAGVRERIKIFLMKAVDRIGSAFLRRILRRMKQLGINQTELARRMKVTKPYVTKVLRQDVNFSFRTAAKLARALEMDFLPELRAKEGASLALVLIASLSYLTGCSLFRANPLEQRRGAIVLVFDTRTAGDLKSLRQTLADCDVRATVFAAGRIDRGTAGILKDLKADGHEIGLSGLRGLDPKQYAVMCGQQKFFQDEIVAQVLDARREGLNPRYYLLQPVTQGKREALTLPSFLVAKGFARVVHRMPPEMLPSPRPACEKAGPMVNAYALTESNFDRMRIGALAKFNEILVVSPTRQVLPALLDAARVHGIPFATLSDLK